MLTNFGKNDKYVVFSKRCETANVDFGAVQKRVCLVDLAAEWALVAKIGLDTSESGSSKVWVISNQSPNQPLCQKNIYGHGSHPCNSRGGAPSSENAGAARGGSPAQWCAKVHRRALHGHQEAVYLLARISRHLTHAWFGSSVTWTMCVLIVSFYRKIHWKRIVFFFLCEDWKESFCPNACSIFFLCLWIWSAPRSRWICKQTQWVWK